MATRRLKRPRDPVELGKLIGDILTGQVEDAAPKDGKNSTAAKLSKKGSAARAKATSSERRAGIAKKAAPKRCCSGLPP